MQDKTIFAFPRTEQDRLRLAMRHLEDAVAEQQAALREFRASLGNLRKAAAGLEGSLTSYRATLDSAAAQVGRANQAALELRETASRMEALA